MTGVQTCALPIYRVGAVLEAALEERWGSRLLERAPVLDEAAVAGVRNKKEA